MSRFGNLEFDDASHESDLQNDVVKDEAFYLREAQAAYENGDFESALRRYSKVLEFNPRNTVAWTGQVRALVELGEYREAALWADKALERFPNSPELLAAKAVALGRNGEFQEALAFSDASIEERGDTPFIWLSRGDVLLARGEQRADYCFEKAMMMAKGDWFIIWLAARIRYYYKQFAIALKLFKQALDANSSHFRLWFDLAMCQQAMGMTGLAAVSLQHARQLNPNHEAVNAAILNRKSPGLLTRLRGAWHKLRNR